MSHSSITHLTQSLTCASTKVKVGGLYNHYKSPSSHYKVLYIGLKESSEQPCVIYQSQSHPELIWVRDVDKWCDQIICENKIVPRFSLVEDE